LPIENRGEASGAGLHAHDARTVVQGPVSGEQLPHRDRGRGYSISGRRRLGRGDFHVIGPLDLAAAGTSRDAGWRLPHRPLWSGVKRCIDGLGALLLGALFLPVIIPVAVMLYCESGVVLFRHRRVGRDGRLFQCLKFRSMVVDADRVMRELLECRPDLEAEWLRDQKLRDDPRVTPLGRFLRRTSLDELPQLWNVLLGDMSLVGPRPVVREELMRYGRCATVYLSVRPGMTGLWQVTGRNETNYRRRVSLDVCYVRRQGMLLDLYILAKTVRVVLGGKGAY